MRSSHVAETKEVRPGVSPGGCADRPGDRKADRAGRSATAASHDRTVRMSGPIAHPSDQAIKEQDDQGMAASSGRSKPMLSREPLTTSSDVCGLCGCAAP